MNKINKLLIILLLSNSLAYSQNSGTNIGDRALELAYNNPNGEEMNLFDIKNKLILIDFWASWCGPCRRENPNLVDAFKKYNKTKFKDGNGFEIYSLSLDKNQEAWLKAINQDQLFWEYHVSDLGGWQSEGSQKYNIKSIPSNVLINDKGVIIAKNLKGQALHRFLDSQKK
tara:strand:- start:110 stop:622 length:513 start_codon:yes stop_codon:yes gene_type:complete